jgi:hypothetical protein
MRKCTIVAGALVSAMLASGRAEGANCANITFSPSTTSFTDWNPINPADKTASFTASMTFVPNSTRSTKIIFLDNDSGSPVRIGSAGPQYRITNGANDYAFPSGTAAGGTVAFSVPNGAPPISPSFTITVPANTGNADYVGGVTFTESLRYTIQCFNNGGSNVGTDTLQAGPTINLTIPKLVSITTGSPATINFGSFTTATQSLNVGLKSTSSVNVSVATANVNQMVLAGAVTPYPTNSVIPYTMTLNGDTIANGTSLTNRPRAGVPGTNWPLVLTLIGGLPSGKLAGSYSDTITLTLTPGT